MLLSFECVVLLIRSSFFLQEAELVAELERKQAEYAAMLAEMEKAREEEQQALKAIEDEKARLEELQLKAAELAQAEQAPIIETGQAVEPEETGYV